MHGSYKSMAGIWRSIGMYYWKPRVRRRLKMFYSQFVQPGMLCFDIGAHLGNRTRAFRDLGARVVAVEPQPACLDFLGRKFGDDTGVKIVPNAVDAERGSVVLNISKLYPTISTAADADWRRVVQDAVSYTIDWEEIVEVESLTLDDLIGIHGVPDFCKIDVEGLEANVLQGLSHPIRALSFEFFRETPELTRACVDRLGQIGTYLFNWSKGESQKLVMHQWVTGTQLLDDLDSLPSGHLSGDIYALLTNSVDVR